MDLFSAEGQEWQQLCAYNVSEYCVANGSPVYIRSLDAEMPLDIIQIMTDQEGDR